ncbi:MAG: hypothetical protein WAL84_12465, partial [Candidatus Dormiibacterota bacterium]
MTAPNPRAVTLPAKRTPPGGEEAPPSGRPIRPHTPTEPASQSGRGWIQGVRRPGMLALACAAILGISFTVRPQFDPDFWWHVLVGDRILDGSFPHTDPFTFTAAGHAFTPQEWGSEVIYALLLHLGMWAVICLMAVVTVAGLGMAMRRARPYTRSPAVLAVAAALSLAVALST